MAGGFFAPCPATAADPIPVSVRTAPGRFEIAAVDASAAHQVAAAGEDAWRLLAGPLALPDAFSSPIYVRLISVAEAGDPVPFRVTVEPGGVVSVRLAARGTATFVLRRALVQGLLMRQAVAQHGINERLTAPLWLEHAAVGWWQTHVEAAQLDALKQESRHVPPPLLGALLTWQRGVAEPRDFSLGSVWLLTFLQAESGRAREWPALMRRLLAGEEPLAALAASYPDRYADAGQRELWWQTGYHHAHRARVVPTLEAAASHAQLGALARFVFAGANGEIDVVVPLSGVLLRAGESIVAADLAQRTLELERLIPVLHPFYQNAGLSLAELFRHGSKDATRRDALGARFEQDWRDAMELDAATKAALDALESRARREDEEDGEDLEDMEDMEDA